MRAFGSLGVLGLVSLALACTGAIPEPLDLADTVDPGGWLILENGRGLPVLLRRIEDGPGGARFVDASGELARSVELLADDSISVFHFQPGELLVLERWGEARSPEIFELSVEGTGTRLGECACPVPGFDAKVRLLDGATCAVPRERGRSVEWDGDRWVWSERAQAGVLLHHGAERCAPRPDELLEPALSAQPPPRLAFRLPGERAPYTHFEWIAPDELFVVSQTGFGLVSADGVMRAWQSRSPSEWDVRATFSPEPGSVVGVVRFEPTFVPQVGVIWLVRARELAGTSGASILASEEDREQFSQWTQSEDAAEMSRGHQDVLLVETGSTSGGLIPVELSRGVLLERVTELRELISAPEATWLVTGGQRAVRLATQDLGSAAEGLFLDPPDPMGEGWTQRIRFPRVDLGLMLDRDERSDVTSVGTVALAGRRFVATPPSIGDHAGCAVGLSPTLRAALVSDVLRTITDAGVEYYPRGGCVTHALGSTIVSDRVRPSADEWYLLTEDGGVFVVSRTEVQNDDE